MELKHFNCGDAKNRQKDENWFLSSWKGKKIR